MSIEFDKRLALEVHSARVKAAINIMHEMGCTPYIMVLTNHPETNINPPFPPSVSSRQLFIGSGGGISPLRVSEDDIVGESLALNISIGAVGSFYVSDEGLHFQCRINGNIHSIYIPYEAIFATYDHKGTADANILANYKEVAQCVYEKFRNPQALWEAETKNVIKTEQPAPNDVKPRPSHLKLVK